MTLFFSRNKRFAPAKTEDTPVHNSFAHTNLNNTTHTHIRARARSSQIQASIERTILDPANHDLLAIVKGARNGAVYGTKVRFPHALVMVFLFRAGTVRQKIDLVYRATRTHARNLAKFAIVYKSTCYVLKHYGATPGKEGE